MALAARQIVHTQPFPIEDGWRELGRDAFALWLRLMMVPGLELAGGRNALARTLGLTSRTLGRLLVELRNKGYVRLTRHHDVLEVHILRRALIAGPSGFVRI